MSLFTLLSFRSQLFAMALPFVLLLCGCESTGLSVREQPGDFSAVALSLHDAVDPAKRRAPLPPPGLPVRLAVVQLGEIAPPKDMIDSLRADRKTFADVQPVPSALDRYHPYVSRGNYQSSQDWQKVRNQALTDQIESMQQFARDGGADYLLLFGGTLDQAITRTPLGLFDLTIIGAFIVPSKQLTAEARAGATLIDIRTGRSVMTMNSQANGSRLAPTAYTDDARLKLSLKLRDELTKDLTAQLSERMQRLSAAPARAELR